MNQLIDYSFNDTSSIVVTIHFFFNMLCEYSLKLSVGNLIHLKWLIWFNSKMELYETVQFSIDYYLLFNDLDVIKFNTSWLNSRLDEMITITNMVNHANFQIIN